MFIKKLLYLASVYALALCSQSVPAVQVKTETQVDQSFELVKKAIDNRDLNAVILNFSKVPVSRQSELVKRAQELESHAQLQVKNIFKSPIDLLKATVGVGLLAAAIRLGRSYLFPDHYLVSFTNWHHNRIHAPLDTDGENSVASATSIKQARSYWLAATCLSGVKGIRLAYQGFNRSHAKSNLVTASAIRTAIEKLSSSKNKVQS